MLAGDLCLDDDSRAAVLRMLARWLDCATVQELHDAAGVRPPTPGV